MLLTLIVNGQLNILFNLLSVRVYAECENTRIHNFLIVIIGVVARCLFHSNFLSFVLYSAILCLPRRRLVSSATKMCERLCVCTVYGLKCTTIFDNKTNEKQMCQLAATLMDSWSMYSMQPSVQYENYAFIKRKAMLFVSR